jgi:hypothetical protein
VALALAAAIPALGAVSEVVVVFKTHFDIGYTDMASNVVQRYRTTMIDDALKVVDQNRDLPPEQQFVWTLPGWPLAKISEDWPGQTPERQRRVREAFKQGRFVPHALPFTTHTELLELEDLVRGLVPPADWPYKTWLALIHTGDNHDPPRPEEVNKLLDDAKVKLPGPVRVSRSSSQQPPEE